MPLFYQNFKIKGPPPLPQVVWDLAYVWLVFMLYICSHLTYINPYSWACPNSSVTVSYPCTSQILEVFCLSQLLSSQVCGFGERSWMLTERNPYQFGFEVSNYFKSCYLHEINSSASISWNCMTLGWNTLFYTMLHSGLLAPVAIEGLLCCWWRLSWVLTVTWASRKSVKRSYIMCSNLTRLKSYMVGALLILNQYKTWNILNPNLD